MEWILFLLAAEVLFTVLTGTGNMGLRMAMPMLLAGCILLFRLRDAFVLSPFVKRILLSTIALWAGGGVAIQIKAGEEIMSMLKIYAEDVRGVAPLPPMRLWGWMYSSYRSYLNGQDRMCFRRELGHSTPLTVLTPWLYETLYRNPERFFTKATRLGESGLYVAQQVPSVVVKRGEKVLNPAEDEALRVYRATYQKRQEEGIERFLPGRFRAMVPPAESVLALPAEGKTIEAMDGHLYTLFPVKGTL